MNDVSDKEIQRIVAETYGFLNVAVYPLGENTVSSNVLRIEADSHTYVLKASSWYSGFTDNPYAVLETVYETAEVLTMHDVPLQTARRTREGGFVFTFHDLPTVLLEYKEGTPFDSSAAHFTAAGMGLALFHRAGVRATQKHPQLFHEVQQKVPTEKPYEESRDLYHASFREVLAKSHACTQQTVCDAVRQQLSLLDSTIMYIDTSYASVPQLTQGIVHNDFNSGNVLFTENGSLAAILDVDQLGVGPLITDVGNTLASLLGFFLKDATTQEVEDRVSAFLVSYHSTMPLSLSEYMLLLAATQRWDVMRILRTMRRHHFENDRLPGLLPKLENRLLPRIKMAPEWLSFLSEEWLSKTLSFHHS